MFGDIALHATLPAADLDRAKKWYSEVLGISPTEESEDGGAVWYETGGVRFMLYASQFAGTNQATAASLDVDDFDAAIDQLRGRGVSFEEYDMGEFKTENGVLTLPTGQKAAWFKDSEGNILAIAAM